MFQEEATELTPLRSSSACRQRANSFLALSSFHFLPTSDPIGLVCSAAMRNLSSCLLLVYRRHQLLPLVKLPESCGEGY